MGAIGRWSKLRLKKSCGEGNSQVTGETPLTKFAICNVIRLSFVLYIIPHEPGNKGKDGAEFNQG